MSQSTDNPRYLGDFYYGGTLILQCIKQPATIRNWVTFCGSRVSKSFMNPFENTSLTCNEKRNEIEYSCSLNY